MSVARVRKRGTPPWQYHPRSDHHSKVACWGILFDLLRESPLLVEHIVKQKVAFGINHTMVNFTNGKKKALDLVVCRPGQHEAPADTKQKGKKKKSASHTSFRALADAYAIELSEQERQILEALPDVPVRPVGSVLIALEAKAAMTEFAKARPRLYDELESSHVTVHNDTNHAIAVGLALINASPTFISPTANQCIAWGAPIKTSKHDQPKQCDLTVKHVEALPKRSSDQVPGFDALGALVVNCTNENTIPVTVVDGPPAPKPGDVLHYATMISRVVGWYASRFPNG